jgi:hypothetical protein
MRSFVRHRVLSFSDSSESRAQIAVTESHMTRTERAALSQVPAFANGGSEGRSSARAGSHAKWATFTVSRIASCTSFQGSKGWRCGTSQARGARARRSVAFGGIDLSRCQRRRSYAANLRRSGERTRPPHRARGPAASVNDGILLHHHARARSARSVWRDRVFDESAHGRVRAAAALGAEPGDVTRMVLGEPKVWP